MDERLATLVADLERAETLVGGEFHRSARRSAWVAELSVDQLAEFLTAIGRLELPLTSAADRLLVNWLVAAVHARRKAIATALSREESLEPLLSAIQPLYRGLGASSRSRGQLLAWLATGASTTELELFGRLLLDDPPQADQDVVQAFAPLFQRQRGPAAARFRRLLHAIPSPALAAPVLDLANFLAREKIVPTHAASVVAHELVSLLGELVQTLLRLEERPDQFGDSPREL